MSKDCIAVVSPHQDDAAFSLTLTLFGLQQPSQPVRILNCFTVSNYSPRLCLDNTAEISQIRSAEDKEFVRQFRSPQTLVNLGFLDAPLRLKISSNSVCDTFGPNCLRAEDPSFQELCDAFQPFRPCRMVFIPLALGGHVDHALAKAAALRSFAGVPIGFYEDLPYASRETSDLVRITGELATRVGCLPFVHRVPDGPKRKREMIACYSSQASPGELDSIAAFSENYDSGERLWLTPEARQVLNQAGLRLAC